MISKEMVILLVVGAVCVAWWWWKMRATAWEYTAYVVLVIAAYWAWRTWVYP